MLHSLNKMKLHTCVPFRSFTSPRLCANTESHDATNRCTNQSFFDGTNYLNIIQRLNDGYHNCITIIEYMRSYRDHLLQHAQSLESDSKKWIVIINKQPALSSYHTTTFVFTETVHLSEKEAQIIREDCARIQRVLNIYQHQVDGMYPRQRFVITRDHYRSKEMKQLFQNAHAPLAAKLNKHQKLLQKKIQARNALDQATIDCQNFEQSLTASDKERRNVQRKRARKQFELQAITDDLALVEQERDKEEITYHTEAIHIYEICRQLEEERLEQIRETLLSFCQAVHSRTSTDDRTKLLTDLVACIQTEQDSEQDLDSWAQSYNIPLSRRSGSTRTSDDNESNCSETARSHASQSCTRETEHRSTSATTSEKTKKRSSYRKDTQC